MTTSKINDGKLAVSSFPSVGTIYGSIPVRFQSIDII